jgi:hypothetical protein
MSLVVRPRAYRPTTLALNRSRRVAPLGTITGSKLPLRSRGTSKSTAPISVSTRFGVAPLRLLPDPRPAGSPRS